MSRRGCIGFVIGSLIGLLLAGLSVWLTRPDIPAVSIPPEPATPDATLFLSERSASRLASQALSAATTVDFEPGGRVIVTTQVDFAGLTPRVDLGLSLQTQGDRVVSQLHWLQLGWLRIPARWLPSEIVALGAKPGQTLTQYLPPEFSIVGLTTTAQGVNLQLQQRGK